ncbi:hypothetical protein GALMADRAFT_143477 [Galerina marginata CBS 339.88]|uniref:CCHC-type domain-containing protein n=1 Tax=Galerina marginata (strain CBS 339.88) TaxID=685588 RepID=A0A067SZG2_GALM3|nr:hypothetical protein GALMADRAFT_143477 [Galerina marginata CBS 339.88]
MPGPHSHTRARSQNTQEVVPIPVEPSTLYDNTNSPDDNEHPASEPERDTPPHLSNRRGRSTSRRSSPSIEQSSLERILASQQSIMMESFQAMMNSLVTSQSRIPAHATVSNTKMRMNDPDAFGGSPKNTDSFLNSCLNIFIAQPSVYRTDESKIRFALSFFKSGSLNWRDAVIRDMNDPLYVMPSWSDFEDSVRDSFGNPHRVENAQRELHQIVQGDRTAEEFFIAFEDLKHVAGFCDMAVIFQLKRALRVNIRNELLRRRPTPTTYRGWKDAILQVDQDLRESSTANTFYAPRPQTSRYPFRPLTNVVPPPKTTAVTTSSAVPTSSVKRPFVANAKTVCWKCGGNGHIGRECKEEPKKTGKLTRQLFEEVAELDSNMERVRLLLEHVDELEDEEEDRDVFVRLMSDLPTFFVDSDE